MEFSFCVETFHTFLPMLLWVKNMPILHALLFSIILWKYRWIIYFSHFLFIYFFLSVLDIFTWSNIVLMNTFFSFLRMTFSVTSRKILINMQNKSKVTAAITYMYIWIFLKYAGRVRVIICHIQTHHLAALISL